MFERTANLQSNQIINYKCDPSEKWLVLIGIAPGSPEVCCCLCLKAVKLLCFFFHKTTLTTFLGEI
jgi:hypothetical protein